jgi:hypothetical protein
VPKECFDAGWSRLYLGVVVVVLRVDELIEEFNPFLVQRLCEEPREMFVAHKNPPSLQVDGVNCQKSMY